MYQFFKEVKGEKTHTYNRSLNILRLLIKRLKNQTFWQKLLTVGLMALTVISLFLFFSSYFIWIALKYVMTEGILRFLEWHLSREEEEEYERERQNEASPTFSDAEGQVHSSNREHYHSYHDAEKADKTDKGEKYRYSEDDDSDEDSGLDAEAGNYGYQEYANYRTNETHQTGKDGFKHTL